MFLKKLKEKNAYAYNNLKFKNEYVNNHTKLLAQYKYGDVYVSPKTLLEGRMWKINSAENPTEYFKNMLYDKNNYVYYKIIEFTSNYLDYETDISFMTKYGECKMSPSRLIRTAKDITIESAVNKTDYLMMKLLDVNKQCYDCIICLNSEYKNAKEKIKFKTKYGDCEMSPDSMYNSLPSIISAIDKPSYFKSIANEIHGEKYDYSCIEEIKSMHDKKSIICEKHGAFSQSLSSHVAGIGCPECAKENSIGIYNKKSNYRNREKFKYIDANVYIVKFNSTKTKEIFYKIGVTKNIKNRTYNFKKAYDCEVIIEDVFNLSLYDCILMESYLQKQNANNKYNPKIKFSGYTECFNKIEAYSIEECLKHIRKELTYEY